MKVVFHDDFYAVYTSDPAAAPGRMEAVVAEIGSLAEFVDAHPASAAQLALAHTPSQIESVSNQGLYSIAALAAGGAIQAATIGLTEPCFALVRPLKISENFENRRADYNSGKDPYTADYKPWRIKTAVAFSV